MWLTGRKAPTNQPTNQPTNSPRLGCARRAGFLDPGGREREDPRGHQSPAGRHLTQPEQGAAGGGPGHGLRGARLLHPHPGRVHVGPDDAHHAAHAAGLPPGLRAQEQGAHWLQGAAELVHADRQGHGLLGGARHRAPGPGRQERPG